MTPGIHEIPAAQYHSGPGVSNSMLSRIERSPAHLRAYLDGPREEQTAAMIAGTLTHLAILEPDKFGDGLSHFTRPEGMTFTTKEGKQWKAEHSELPIISGETLAQIIGRRDAVMRHDIARLMLKKGKAEQSLYAVHAPTGVLRRGRLDWLTEDSRGIPCIMDIKTTDDARDFTKKAARFNYHAQNAYYADLAESVGLEGAAFVFCVVEHEAPHGVRMVQFDATAVSVGREKYERGLALYAECEAANHWPAYATEIETITLTAWAK